MPTHKHILTWGRDGSVYCQCGGGCSFYADPNEILELVAEALEHRAAVEAEQERCVWTEVGTGQWRPGCGARPDLGATGAYCPHCSKSIARKEASDGNS